MLRYSVGDACTYSEILEEDSLAVWQARSHAEEWHINPNAIVVMGFSAVLSRFLRKSSTGMAQKKTAGTSTSQSKNWNMCRIVLGIES